MRPHVVSVLICLSALPLALHAAPASGGADPAQLIPLDESGSPITLINGLPSATPSCIHDQVTGLIWEVKRDDDQLRDKDWTYTWHNPEAANPGLADGNGGCFGGSRCDTAKFVADVNAVGLCGYHSGWRLPSRKELVTIGHSGRFSSPQIDQGFFPNTVNGWYWSRDDWAPDNGYAWLVLFRDGYPNADLKSKPFYIRLVHQAP